MNTEKSFAELKEADDARFGPMLSEMDEITERHDLLAGENIYLLTLLLIGSIGDAPADVRELFRGAVVQAILRDKGASSVLRALCLERSDTILTRCHHEGGRHESCRDRRPAVGSSTRPLAMRLHGR